MRSDSHISHIYPARTEITSTQHIPILHVCSMDESESEEFLVGKTLLHVCSTDEDESKIIIIDESSTEEIKS